jgi:tetratricopeptide (TPR) repeat protein
VRTNIGWVLLEQKKYKRARGFLEEAIKRYENDEKLQSKKHNNMAYCFLAQLNDEQNNTKEGAKLWGQCIDNAKPEFVHQYNWFIKNKKEKIAYCVNTTNIVTGFAKERNEYAKTFCEDAKNELKDKI